MQFNSTKELIYYLAEKSHIGYSSSIEMYGRQEEELSLDDKFKSKIFNQNKDFESNLIDFFSEIRDGIGNNSFHEARFYVSLIIENQKLNVSYSFSANESFIYEFDEENPLEGYENDIINLIKEFDICKDLNSDNFHDRIFLDDVEYLEDDEKVDFALIIFETDEDEINYNEPEGKEIVKTITEFIYNNIFNDNDTYGDSGKYELSKEDLLPFDDNIKYVLNG